MGYIAGLDRQQVVLFPEAIDDFIREANPVRFLDTFVGSLDLVALGFGRSIPAQTGRPGYDPGDLLRLYLYGYLHRIRSSRHLEAEAGRNLELMWLLRRLTSYFKTIADFRKDNGAALRKVCREFTLLAKRLDLFSAELVAIDGSKFRAVNSRDRNFKRAKLEKLLRQIDERIQGYLAALDEGDQTESTTPPVDAEALRQKIATLQERKEEYEKVQAQLEASGEGQISLSDPESRSMKTRAGGTDVCYNAQIAVDEKHKLICAHEVTNEATDIDHLSPVAMQAQEVLGVEALDMVADRGYYHGAEVKACEEAGISAYVAKPQTSANVARGLYTKEDFVYEAQQDAYRCPAGQMLSFGFETQEKGRQIRYYRTSACGSCALKAQCTRS